MAFHRADEVDEKGAEVAVLLEAEEEAAVDAVVDAGAAEAGAEEVVVAVA